MSGPVARRDKAPEVMNKMRTQTAGLRTGNPVLSADTFRDVHATAALRGWLAAAGLVALEEHRLAAAPEAVVLVGHKPG